MGEVRENGVAAVDVSEISLDELALMPFGAAAEVAPRSPSRTARVGTGR
jgi:hypothetical protein